MERRKRPYSIHRRPASHHRHIYYARFRDESGAYFTAVSTGCSRRDDAIRWAEGYLERGQQRKEHITLAEHANGFWKPDAPFALGRAAHGRAVSLTHLDIAEGYTRNHLLPVWGDWRLRDLSTKRIDAWLVDLYRRGDLAPATVNKLLQTLRTILSFAVVDGWLSESPAEYVRPVRAPRLERDILTMQEAARLLAGPAPWGHLRHYAINALAATTGMRMGEIRGLRVEKREKRSRRGPLLLGAGVRAEATEGGQREGRADLAQGCGDPSAGDQGDLARALTFIGIPFVEQRRRNLSFHGWRHFLNTMLRSRGVPDAKVRQITGHRSEQMSNWHTHLKTGDFGEVVELQTALLATPPAAAVL